MDSTRQAEGEKRVKELLIDPLLRRGLARPTSLTKVQFEAMTADLCARLAYMSGPSLMALEEQVATSPGGKDKDRFPIANRILEWAAQIQPPGDDASPLIRAVFANALGQDAVAEGWAPELLAELRHNRRWPGAFVVKTVKDKAAPNIRQMQILSEKRARGAALSFEEEHWHGRRKAALGKCRQIAKMSSEGVAC
ncbi:hypothetical protein [Palleronia caenipelagi]|uniref:Uncharacterized protein n=1 Tax=Palleronia caenipelagi TaxID=2489174 RepID=A0A547PS17_9RHOB|nr:hypothetical protein [Palleronia caenipelagi]TRD16947.1 hypothetical protein FEV53_13495 [Palleronia caenipelagi]